MANTPSTMLPLGTTAPDFALADAFGKKHTLASTRGPNGLLVMFICNHCPFVKHIADSLAKVSAEFIVRGVGVVAVNANDFEKYPDDCPEKMRDETARRAYTFPYLIDADQTVAKAYQAACTPDFYLFDKNLMLVYRGQWDDARPSNDKAVTGHDMQAAVDCMLGGMALPALQRPSLGCNIKWKPGNAPAYSNLFRG